MTMDRKMLASGEPYEKELNVQEKRLEMAEQALEFLITFTQAKLPQDQIKPWITRLSTVPAWKLMKLADFSESHITKVWKFFDDLKTPPPEAYNKRASLPEPQTGVAKDVMTYINKLFFSNLMEAQCDQLERDHVAAMEKKYPGRGWRCMRRANNATS